MSYNAATIGWSVTLRQAALAERVQNWDETVLKTVPKTQKLYSKSNQKGGKTVLKTGILV